MSHHDVKTACHKGHKNRMCEHAPRRLGGEPVIRRKTVTVVTTSVAEEVARHGITVKCICPGMTRRWSAPKDRLRAAADDCNTPAGKVTHLPHGQGFPPQWVQVDDIASGLILALSVEAPSECVFNRSGGINPTIDKVAGIVRGAIPNTDIRLEAGADP
jgi:nucleoside-diphosphate-sugar epimerase